MTDTGDVGHRDIRSDGQPQRESGLLAILGQQRDAGRHRLARRTNAPRLSGHPYDLARMETKANVLQLPPSREMFDAEQFLARRNGIALVNSRDLTPDH